MQTKEMIPLISPKPFADYSPEDFHAYVRSMYVEPVKPAPLAEVSARLNNKGNPVITVRREPKFLLPAEIDQLASDLSWSRQAMWAEVAKRKIEIRIALRGKTYVSRAAGPGKKRTSSGKSSRIKS